MKVGSIKGAGAVGGRNGVGVEAGEHADRRRRIEITASNCRGGEERKFIVIKKGRPVGSPQQSN
jgi:hypothetical protein